jgi:hypothetical protein
LTTFSIIFSTILSLAKDIVSEMWNFHIFIIILLIFNNKTSGKHFCLLTRIGVYRTAVFSFNARPQTLIKFSSGNRYTDTRYYVCRQHYGLTLWYRTYFYSLYSRTSLTALVTFYSYYLTLLRIYEYSSIIALDGLCIHPYDSLWEPLGNPTKRSLRGYECLHRTAFEDLWETCRRALDNLLVFSQNIHWGRMSIPIR